MKPDDQTKRILIVEEDGLRRERLESLLTLAGYRVYVAADGREAQDCLRCLPPPHLILLDLAPPVTDGEELLKRMKRRPRWSRIPVVALAGSPDAPEPLPPVRETIRQPASVEEIMSRVSAHC